MIRKRIKGGGGIKEQPKQTNQNKQKEPNPKQLPEYLSGLLLSLSREKLWGFTSGY